VGAYLANGRMLHAGDAIPARYLPWSVLRHATLDLDAFPEIYDERARMGQHLVDGLPFYLRRYEGHYLSAYSPGAALVALPIHAVPVLAGAPLAWAPALEKIAAAVITALSAVALLLALERLVTRGWAVALALVYALGTSSLSSSAQNLWQHGPSQLFVAIVLWLVTRPSESRASLLLTGFAMTAAVAVRGTGAVLLLPLGLWLVWRRPMRAPWLALGSAPPVAAVLLYNLRYFGTPLPGGARTTTAPAWALFAQTSLLEGLAGVLASPARGLFVYSPVLVVSVVGLVLAWRSGPAILRPLSVGAGLLVLVVGKWAMWWGGACWGPRLLADALPILVLLMAPATPWLTRSRALTAGFGVLVVLSVAAHALGAFRYDTRWDIAGGLDPPASRFWSWADGPLVFYGRPLIGRIGRSPSPPLAADTSRSAPEGLRAALRVSRLQASAMPGEPFALSINATNTGRSTWLAEAPGDRGSVRLAWRWWRDAVATGEGRALLDRDVLPGASVDLAPVVRAPDAPGTYTLVLDMVSEGITWFESQGHTPERLQVVVEPLDVAHVLGRLAHGATAHRLVAAVATDRRSYAAGERLRLTVRLDNPRMRGVDAYLILEGPGGAWSFDGQTLAPSGGAWRPWLRSIPMPARLESRHAISLPAVPAGDYAWHALVTEAGSFRLLAAARAELRVAEPGAAARP
jgi:hypothetical protein